MKNHQLSWWVTFFSNKLNKNNSFEFPITITKEIALSITYILEIIKDKNIKFFNIIDSNKDKIKNPTNIYETSILYGFELVNVYKNDYQLDCQNIFYQDFINNII